MSDTQQVTVAYRQPVQSRRRALAAGAAGALVVTAFGSACAGAAGSGAGSSGQDQRGGGRALPVPRTVEYWSQYGGGVQLETQQKLVQRYQELNPGVTVNTAVAPMVQNVPEKTVAAIASGAPPDAAIFDRFLIATFAVKDTFVDLTGHAKQDGIGEKDYYPFAWREAGYKGKVYALPNQTGIRGVFLNRTHLREAGLAPEQLPRTLTDLDQLAVRLTRQEGDGFSRVGFVPWIGNSHFYTWGWLFGGEFLDEKANRCTANEPRIGQAMEWLAGYARRLGDTRTRAFEGTFGQTQGGAFGGGLVTFFHTTQALIDDLARTNPQLDYDTMPLPPAPGQTKTSSWAGGFGYFIPRGAKQPDAAWHLIKFLGSDEGELTWTQGTLTLPVRINAAKAKYFQDRAQDRRFKVFLDLLPVARSRPVTPAAQALWDELLAAVDQVREGALLPKDALDGVTQRVNLELAKYG
jgi:multiple sugar transport system substrate-binding protein